MQVQGCWHALATLFLNSDAVLGKMECLLRFETWLDQPTFWEIGNATGETAERVEVAIASLMRLIEDYVHQEEFAKIPLHFRACKDVVQGTNTRRTMPRIKASINQWMGVGRRVGSPG